MHRIGAFLEAGGNKVFFVNGVLAALAREGIEIDYLAGYSSAAPIVLAHFAGRHMDILDDFAERLDSNRKNFYWFKRPHFPQDDIYRAAVTALVEHFRSYHYGGSFEIYGAATTSRFRVLKSILTSLFLLLRYSLHINLLWLLRRILNIEPRVITEHSDMSRERLVRFIMGSSSLYPFIGHYRVGHDLILEGALLEVPPSVALENCLKKIVIHTDQGVSGTFGNVFHIYAADPIPNNILDYTDGSAVRTLHTHGEAVVGSCVAELRAYLAD